MELLHGCYQRLRGDVSCRVVFNSYDVFNLRWGGSGEEWDVCVCAGRVVVWRRREECVCGGRGREEAEVDGSKKSYLRAKCRHPVFHG